MTQDSNNLQQKTVEQIVCHIPTGFKDMKSNDHE